MPDFKEKAVEALKGCPYTLFELTIVPGAAGGKGFKYGEWLGSFNEDTLKKYLGAPEGATVEQLAAAIFPKKDGVKGAVIVETLIPDPWPTPGPVPQRPHKLR